LFCDFIGLSEWHIEAMTKGASCVVEYDLYLDLKKSIEEIKSGLRKSYKSLVIARNYQLEVNVLDYFDENVWDEFKSLHYFVSGRKTRSDLTWNIHLDDIKKENGFLIFIRDDCGSMIGGGFFNYSRDEGFYSVGAYRRDFSHKPLGHLIQFKAIVELKKRGARWYRLGVRPYRTLLTPPSEKEMSIGDFKQGFSSHLFPRYLLLHQVSHLKS
jgi:FemAB family protein